MPTHTLLSIGKTHKNLDPAVIMITSVFEVLYQCTHSYRWWRAWGREDNNEHRELKSVANCMRIRNAEEWEDDDRLRNESRSKACAHNALNRILKSIKTKQWKWWLQTLATHNARLASILETRPGNLDAPNQVRNRDVRDLGTILGKSSSRALFSRWSDLVRGQ